MQDNKRVEYMVIGQKKYFYKLSDIDHLWVVKHLLMAGRTKLLLFHYNGLTVTRSGSRSERQN